MSNEDHLYIEQRTVDPKTILEEHQKYLYQLIGDFVIHGSRSDKYDSIQLSVWKEKLKLHN